MFERYAIAWRAQDRWMWYDRRFFWLRSALNFAWDRLGRGRPERWRAKYRIVRIRDGLIVRRMFRPYLTACWRPRRCSYLAVPPVSPTKPDIVAMLDPAAI